MLVKKVKNRIRVYMRYEIPDLASTLSTSMIMDTIGLEVGRIGCISLPLLSPFYIYRGSYFGY